MTIKIMTGKTIYINIDVQQTYVLYICRYTWEYIILSKQILKENIWTISFKSDNIGDKSAELLYIFMGTYNFFMDTTSKIEVLFSLFKFWIYSDPSYNIILYQPTNFV